MQSRPTQAVEELRQAIAQGSRDPHVYGDLAYLLGDMLHHEEALRFYERAIELASDNLQKADFLLELGWGRYLLGRHD